ncbi:hypothetical protein GTR02_16445 [Kineococcus sp. R8]|nr:hypothetical protein [Kineococcus siccus]
MDGLPVHALVVHGVTVLVPLTVLGVLAVVVLPRWRERFGPLVVAVGAVATVLCPLATGSGEALQARVGDPGEHAQLGDQLVWFVLPLTLLALVLVLLDRGSRRARRTPGPRRTVTGVVAALCVVAAVAAGVQVYRVGESGARAVWGGQVAATEPSGAAS